MPTRELAELRWQLRSLASSRWIRLWAPGGVIARPPRAGEGVFCADLVVEAERALFSLSADVSVVDGREVCFMAIDEIPEVGTAESEHLFRPPRRVVEEFPRALNISEFFGGSLLSVAVLSDSENVAVGALLRSAVETELAVWANADLPESLACSTNAAIIAGQLESMKVIELA